MHLPVPTFCIHLHGLSSFLPHSLQEYNEAVMITVEPAAADAEEADHNRMIRERLTASLLASTSGGGVFGGGAGYGGGAAATPSGSGKASGGRGRGRGCA
jgi:hypothetical protein